MRPYRQLAILVLALCGPIAVAQKTANADDWGCQGPVAMSADEKASRLTAGLDQTDNPSARCIAAYLEELSEAGDRRSLNLAIRYLDLENPLTGSEMEEKSRRATGPTLFGDQYPALSAVVRFGKVSIPALVDAIGASNNFDKKEEIAVKGIMALEARNPQEGVQLLVDSARRPGSANPQALLKAAQYATTTWQCHLILDKCKGALEAIKLPQSEP